jgi:hypothetical protein
MNEWQKLATAIANEIAEFPQGRSSESGESTPREIVDRELYKGEDVDAAVNSFSTSGRWPLLSATENYYIHRRLKFGLLVAQALAATDPMHAGSEDSLFPSPSPDFSMDLQLQWLLIAAWKSAGRAAWAKEMIGH